MGRKKEKHGGKTEPEEAVTSVMQFMIKDIPNFNDKLYVCQANKLNWTAHIYRGHFQNEDYVVLDVYCHCYTLNWSCDASLDIRIWEKSLYVVEQHFESKKNCMSCPPFIKWADFINPEKGYIHEGRVLLDILISVLPKKTQKNSVIVLKEYPGIKNLMITVGKSKFHVNKELLAETSKFFQEELSSGRLTDEYSLEDVAPCDFQLYLDLTYNPKQYFASPYARDMVLTAKRLGNHEIINTCQNVIMEELKEYKVSIRDRAKIAEHYGIDAIKDMYNPEALETSGSRPRFMTLERYKIEEARPQTKTHVLAVKPEPLQKYRESFRRKDELKVEEPKKVEKVEEKEEEDDDDVIFVTHVDHRAKQREEQEKWATIVAEEEYDMTKPSTSGCNDY